MEGAPRSPWHRCVGRLSDMEGVVKGRARQVDGYVRDNPWQALAIAGGVAVAGRRPDGT